MGNKVNPFDFVKSINQTKENLLDHGYREKDYIPFIVNNTLSYFPDTILLSQMMNECGVLSHKMQYKFLLNMVSRRNRFTSWTKLNEDANIDLLMKHYNYSYQKAKEAYNVLSDDDLKKIKELYEFGRK